MAEDSVEIIDEDSTSTASNPQPADRQALRAEIERRSAGQRLTPAHRRIAQQMIENSAQLGFLSSMELAEVANVSQPSVTRFAVALGFGGYLEMRKFLRTVQRDPMFPERASPIDTRLHSWPKPQISPSSHRVLLARKQSMSSVEPWPPHGRSPSSDYVRRRGWQLNLLISRRKFTQTYAC